MQGERERGERGGSRERGEGEREQREEEGRQGGRGRETSPLVGSLPQKASPLPSIATVLNFTGPNAR